MSTIEVRDLVKTYRARGRSAQPVTAVDGVSLEVPAGEIFAFLGPNGAGKTTIVRVLTTLLAPTAGNVRVAGHDVAADPAAVRRAIGAALQEAGLDPLQTGRELLILQAQLQGVAAPASRAAELLDVVGLADVAQQRIGTLSGGMRRRLDLAAALVHRPGLLFLDEPTTGLDPAARADVWAEVQRLRAAGTTVFLTTQYLEEADSLADRLAIIDRGRLVTEGAPEALKSAIGADVITVTVASHQAEAAAEVLEASGPATRVRRSGATLEAAVADGARQVPALACRLNDAGITLASVTMRRPTLDDVFLRATGHELSDAAPSDRTVPQADPMR